MGVRGSPRQAAIGGLPLVGGLPFAMLAKSEDLTFPSLPNVIFSCCQYVFQYYLQRERWTIMLSYIANNRRLLPSATEAGLFNLLLFRKAQIAVALRTFESASPLTVTSLVFLLLRLRSQ